MRFRLLLILHITLLPLLFSCRSSKHLTSSAQHQVQAPVSEEAYVQTYKDIAVSEMKRTGIPASITLAQGMIESDNGRSMLAREANNHFGIKCHNDWTGPKIYHEDDSKDECFRKYARAEDSFYDHSEFLKNVPRYKFLFDISPKDYKGWAQGLKKAGYATNPDYANMLIRTIEEKNLTYYDNNYKVAENILPPPAPVKQNLPVPVKQNQPVQDSGKMPVVVSPVNDRMAVSARVPRVMENNKLRYIIVKDGDTREKLEDEFQLLRWELPKYNELENDFTLAPGQILYLQSKKEKAEPGKEFYTTVDGDSMYFIAQKYGIKLKSLYKMNRMEEKTEPAPGSTIWLRNIKPVN